MSEPTETDTTMSDPFIATLAFIAVISIPALAVALWATWIDLRDTQADLEDCEYELARARSIIHRLHTGITSPPVYPYDFDENIDNDHWQHF